MRVQCALLLLIPATLSAQSPTLGDWPVYGGGPESMRYSSLQQITRQNVKRLKVAWTFDASDGVQSSELEVNPIVVNGVLYATTVSLNAAAYLIERHSLPSELSANLAPAERLVRDALRP